MVSNVNPVTGGALCDGIKVFLSLAVATVLDLNECSLLVYSHCGNPNGYWGAPRSTVGNLFVLFWYISCLLLASFVQFVGSDLRFAGWCVGTGTFVSARLASGHSA